MAILFSSIFSGVGLLWDRQFGFLKETLVAPVPRIQIMVGRTLGGATTAMIQGTLVLTVCLIAGFRPHDLTALPLALLFMALIAVVFAALGTVIGSALRDMQGFQMVMNFVVIPIFFLSGALFPLANLPVGLEIATRLDPLSYGIDGLRGALIGQSHFGLITDLAVSEVFSSRLGQAAIRGIATGSWLPNVHASLRSSSPKNSVLLGRAGTPKSMHAVSRIRSMPSSQAKTSWPR